MTSNGTQQESALHRVADSILILDATVRRLATDIQALARDVLHLGDRRDREVGAIQRDLDKIQRDIDDLSRQIGKARDQIEENSGPHPKADADEWRDEPSVVVKFGGRWTFARIVGGLAKAWPLFLAGAGYGARWLVERLNQGGAP
jgi:hypothetical protein